MLDLLWVTLAAGLAGFVDAIVGGGGLILLPTLFAVHPSALPATLFGTNKAAAIGGTAWACSQYARRVTMNWGTLAPAAVTALLASFAGAWLVTMVPATGLRKALPLVLLVVLLYTLWRKDLGRVHAPHLSPRREALRGLVLGALIGFYDGFFGPGTGSFLIFLFVRCYAWDFLRASAAAKVVNVSTNLAALAWFVPVGAIMAKVAAAMAVANLAGAWVGAHLAIKNGASFVRRVFIVVVSVLIARLVWDTFAGFGK